MDERADPALQDALEFAESIINTMHEPLLVLDKGLRVVSAGREFYRTFGVSREETAGQLVYDLGNRQWDIPQLRTLLEEILPRESAFRDFEVEHSFEHIGRKVMLLNARKLSREHNGSERILLVIEDVTERRDGERARREAETRFTEMVKNVRDHSIFLTDPGGVITSWNVAAERVIGYTEAEAVGKHFSLIFTPEDVRKGLPEWELETAREQGRAEDERWHLRKGGGRFWALGIVTPLRDAGGLLTGFSKILRDVTERKNAEDALRESRAFHELIAGLGSDWWFLARVEADGAVVTETLSDEFTRQLGYTRDELMAAGGWRAIVHPDELAGAEHQMARLLAGETIEGEMRHVARDGRVIWYQYHTRPGFDASGRVVRLYGASRNIDERKRSEEALRQNEERFRQVVEGARGFAMFSLDDAGRITSWNPAAEALLGWTEAEAVGRPGAIIFTAEDRAAGKPEEEMAGAVRDGRAIDERWHVRQDGSRFWGSGEMTAAGPGGGQRGFVKVLRDHTARKLAEDRLRESEERLRVALSAADMGTWLWRIPEDEQILDDSLRRLMGLPAGEEVKTLDGFLQAVHPQDRDRVRAGFDRCLREGGDVNVEFRVTWPDGSLHWLRDRGKVFHGQDGRPLFMAGAAVDITERRQMEEEMREVDRRKDEFLAMLGHELRNPLAPLRGVMETLQRQQLDEGGLSRAYAMMDRQVAHLTRLVDDLLDVSRITRGLVELRAVSTDLSKVVAHAVEMAAPAVEGRGHDLNVSLPSKPLSVEGDPTRLAQVIFNLLHNAAKYTDPGGRIWLTVEREGARAVVRVRDDGNGLDPELLPRVFDLFAQGERKPDRSQGGLGLGLTLVRRLVELHGGTVEAHSDGLGKGSEFTVRLPALPAEAGAPRPPRPTGPRPATVQVGRVLVVDDNPDVAESLAWMLEGLAREVRMAHSGAAALESVRAWRPDVILCDIGMPGMDGHETCRHLRRVPGLEKTLIAAVSGYGSEEDRRGSKLAGFDRHLVKPVGRATLEELAGAVAQTG